MRTAFVLTLGLMMAILMVFVAPIYLASGGQPQQVSAQQPVTAGKDTVQSPSGGDQNLFVPACILDSTLIDRMTPGNPGTDNRSSRDTPQSAGPAKHYKVGTFECQS